MKTLDERTIARLAETGWLLAGYALAVEHVHRRNAGVLPRLSKSTAGWEPVGLRGGWDSVNERRPQLNGAVLHWGPDGELTAGPVADPVGLDARRAAVDPPALTDAVAAAMSRARQAGEGPPAGSAERDREALVWAKGVGGL